MGQRAMVVICVSKESPKRDEYFGIVLVEI